MSISAPRDLKFDWNKGRAIWFPSSAGLAAKQIIAAQRPAFTRIEAGQYRTAVAQRSEMFMSAPMARARGD